MEMLHTWYEHYQSEILLVRWATVTIRPHQPQVMILYHIATYNKHLVMSLNVFF